GFEAFWGDPSGTPVTVSYSVDWYNPTQGTGHGWNHELPYSTGPQTFRTATQTIAPGGPRTDSIVDAAYPAQRAGTYRISIQPLPYTAIVSRDFDVTKYGTQT